MLHKSDVFDIRKIGAIIVQVSVQFHAGNFKTFLKISNIHNTAPIILSYYHDVIDLTIIKKLVYDVLHSCYRCNRS